MIISWQVIADNYYYKVFVAVIFSEKIIHINSKDPGIIIVRSLPPVLSQFFALYD